MRYKNLIIVCLMLILSFSIQAKINVVTTTSDLKYIAEQIGKDKVNVHAMIRGFDDPHFVMTRPNYILMLNDADVFCEIGLDLEIGWSPLLLEQSRNIKIQKGQPGYCDASVGINILGKPTYMVDRSMGDLHIYGNPHYWTDPVNSMQIGFNLYQAMSKVDPENKQYYKTNLEQFKKRMVSLIKEEMKKFEPYFGTEVAIFHDEFIYLANRFKFKANLTLEERPGVPPSNRYLETIIKNMTASKIKVILISPPKNPKYAQYVASKVPGSVVVTMPLSVGSMPGIETYEDSIREMLKKLREAIDQTTGKKK